MSATFKAPSFAVVLAECADELPAWLPADLRAELEAHFADEDCYGTDLVLKCGDSIIIKTDGGAPEDQTFSRDLDWVPEALQRAHGQGRLDALAAVRELALPELSYRVDDFLARLLGMTGLIPCGGCGKESRLEEHAPTRCPVCDKTRQPFLGDSMKGDPMSNKHIPDDDLGIPTPDEFREERNRAITPLVKEWVGKILEKMRATTPNRQGGYVVPIVPPSEVEGAIAHHFGVKGWDVTFTPDQRGSFTTLSKRAKQGSGT